MRTQAVLLPVLAILLAPVLSAQNDQTRLRMFEAHLASGRAAWQQSRYLEADRQFRLAIEDTESFDETDPARPGHMADALEALCDLDLLTGKYDEAISLEERAVDVLDRALGPDSHDLGSHLLRLAGAYRAGGQTAKAIPILERTVSIDAGDPRLAADYDALGSSYTELKQMDDARSAYRKALDTRVARLGPDHVDVAGTWFSLGAVEEKDLRIKEARADYEKSLSIYEKKLGDESYSLTGVLDRLGLMLRRDKNYGDAEPILQRSLSIREKTLGARHSDVALALDNLALTYFYDNKFVEAEPPFARSLQIWLAGQGPYSPLVAQALDNLASLYSAQQRYGDAEPLFRRALAIRERQDVESLSNLALLYEAQKDFKNADAFFQRALLIGEKGLGGDHIEVADTLDAYATFLRATGRLTEAKKVMARLQELKDHPPAAKDDAAKAK